VWISGQIGLIPSSLSLPSPSSLPLELALSSQHVGRITSVLRNSTGGRWKGHAQAVIYWLADPVHLIHTKRGCEIHNKVSTSNLSRPFQSCWSSSYGFVKKDDIPTIFLVVKALPKAALVEKQVLLHTGRCFLSDDEYEDPSLQFQVPIFTQGQWS
jgi:diphthine-ammonia ligase